MTTRLLDAARPTLVGGAIGLLAFGSAFVVLAVLGDPSLLGTLTEEDGAVETIGAVAFAVAAGLHILLFWRSDVPVGRRLIAFMRRNPFYLGLAAALFLAFAEEISWGQRIFGWATPAAINEINTQGETNIHNLTPFTGMLSLTRAWNLFWLGYCVLLPLSMAAVPPLAALYRRISIPVPPLWIAGLFVGCYASFRLYISLEPAGPLVRPDEAKEAFLAICWVVLGLTYLLQPDSGPDEAPDRQPSSAAQAHKGLRSG